MSKFYFVKVTRIARGLYVTYYTLGPYRWRWYARLMTWAHNNENTALDVVMRAKLKECM